MFCFRIETYLEKPTLEEFVHDRPKRGIAQQTLQLLISFQTRIMVAMHFALTIVH